MYGQNKSDEESWVNYMKFLEENGSLEGQYDEGDPDNSKQEHGLPATSIGKSKHLNSNTDFTVAGVHTQNTKHVPYSVRRQSHQNWKQRIVWNIIS